jgi:hypothetical protein
MGRTGRAGACCSVANRHRRRDAASERSGGAAFLQVEDLHALSQSAASFIVMWLNPLCRDVFREGRRALAAADTTRSSCSWGPLLCPAVRGGWQRFPQAWMPTSAPSGPMAGSGACGWEEERLEGATRGGLRGRTA